MLYYAMLSYTLHNLAADLTLQSSFPVATAPGSERAAVTSSASYCVVVFSCFAAAAAAVVAAEGADGG